MSEILRDFTSVHGLITVVIAVLINIASAYLKPLFDRIFSRVSRDYAARLLRQREERERTITRVFQSNTRYVVQWILVVLHVQLITLVAVALLGFLNLIPRFSGIFVALAWIVLFALVSLFLLAVRGLIGEFSILGAVTNVAESMADND